MSSCGIVVEREKSERGARGLAESAAARLAALVRQSWILQYKETVMINNNRTASGSNAVVPWRIPRLCALLFRTAHHHVRVSSTRLSAYSVSSQRVFDENRRFHMPIFDKIVHIFMFEP